MTKLNTVYQWAGASLTGLLAMLAPVKVAFVIIFLVIVADFMTGVWASRIKKISISSRRFRQSIKKMVGYFEVIFILFIIEFGFEFSFGSWRFVGGFICFIEFISILENTAVITENKVFLNIIQLIRGKAEDTFGDVVDNIIKEKNDEEV